DMTVSENVDFFAEIFGVKDYQRRKAELLDWTGLAPFTERLAERLSGGMKQKLALVCSLIHTPDLLLLDEPTTGVDPISRREFWRILSDIRELGVTILVTTPYMDEAERCTRVALMNTGQILSCGDPVEMRSKEGRSDVEIVTDAPRRAIVWLREQPGVQDVTLLGTRVICRYPPEQQIDHLIDGLRSVGITVTGVRRVAPSFENLFVRMLLSHAEPHRRRTTGTSHLTGMSNVE
ncbi:MAG: ABC transporter ATP-binding protein, partial [Candidatus Latescibacteria bacterium]|nr:ABC transporter ATP-binding protein [Candidatus Latescibacterota bacterium]